MKDMSYNISAHIKVKGLVQGVGFRWFVRAEANRLGLTGTVANLPDGRVEIKVEGERSAIEELISALKKGNGYSRVDKMETDFDSFTGGFEGFKIKMTDF